MASFTVGQDFLIDIFGNAGWKAISIFLTLGILIYLVLNYYRYRQRRQISS